MRRPPAPAFILFGVLRGCLSNADRRSIGVIRSEGASRTDGADVSVMVTLQRGR